MPKARVLIVEDDSLQAGILADYLKHKGFEVQKAESAREARELLLSSDFDLVLLDWRLPDEDGLSFLTYLKENFPFLQVIMITAFATVERAVEAMQKGAYHYLTKPLNLEELLLVVKRALEELKLKREVEVLRRRLKEVEEKPSEIVAESQAMREVLALAAKVARTEATVLILGESGTGKEVLADLIHRLSPRCERPFLKINCAAIPEGLLESELFGHEKGAFTGADRPKAGLFEAANGGTIFLDEIGDLPQGLQAKLLRVLQEKTLRRVGGLQEIQVDVRVIAATNKDLEEMVREGRFREDLFWRLNVFTIKIPPLRERKEDIWPLANFFLKKYAERYGKELKGFSREAAKLLLNYHFPGNVRELENLVERAVILAEGEVVTTEDLPAILTAGEETRLVESLSELPLPEAVAILEKKRIKEALRQSGGVKTRAAQLLGISERMLRYKLQKYGLESEA